ncbi:hypothetical protein J5N97_028273 [Dioscorea zingiberensis]|uniref:Uncharacterized protein n=1 Tax=Dioscorea zingiberensis TaxID=325984 RepID=A0A9D5H4P6_9LILI|nr:hypothetical protein J5N97_028273 [Dioscorea zingiberensis]
MQFNKEYKVARDKPFPLFLKIHELAGSSTATGQYAGHTACGEYTDTPIVEVQESTDSTGDAAEKHVEKHTETGQQTDMNACSKDYASGSSKRKPVRNSSTARTKKRSQEQTQEVVEKLVDLSTRRSIIGEELKSKDDMCSYSDCVDQLKTLPDITDEELFIAGKLVIFIFLNGDSLRQTSPLGRGETV